MKTVICLIIATGFWFFGLLFLLISSRFKRSMEEKKKRCSCLIKAAVADIQCDNLSTTGDPSYTWYPFYEYMVNGKKFKVRGNVGNKRDHFQISQLVTLYYDPADPEVIYVPEENPEKAVLIFRLISVVFLLFGIVVIVLMRIM